MNLLAKSKNWILHDFSLDFCIASQDILEKVDQEAIQKYDEKDKKATFEILPIGSYV